MTRSGALAVGIAWWLSTLLGEPLPLFAALGVLVSMEATAADLHTLVARTAAGLREATRAFTERSNHDGVHETLERLRATRATIPDPRAHPKLAGTAPPFLVDAAEALSHALERYEAYVRTGTQESLPEVGRDLERMRAALAACLQASERDRDAGAPIQRIVDVGAIAAEPEHLTGDVAAVLDLLPYRQMREEQPIGEQPVG